MRDLTGVEAVPDILMRGEFARLLGVSVTTVDHWSQAGMPKVAGGRIAVRDALDWVVKDSTARAKTKARARQLLAALDQRDAAPDGENQLDAPSSDAPDEPAIGGTTAVEVVRAVLRAAGHSPGPVLGHDEAQLASAIVAAAASEMKRREAAGELVDRKRVEAAVFALARRERDAWLTWPARVAADLAARVGADVAPMEAALNATVRAHLREVGDLALELGS